MKISWNWLSELIDLSEVKGPNALAELLTSRGLEVEAIEKQDHGFDKVITAQIISFEKHPQADRLNVCQVTTGQGDPLQIVCGAPNVKAGAKVVLSQPGAHLPNGMKIAVGQIRGVTSNGMLCSEAELGMSTSSEGILILPEDTALGQPVAQVLGRDDTLLTLKLTANRGDCLSHIGIAREVAGALNKPVKKAKVPQLPEAKSPFSVYLEAGEEAPQFFGCTIEGIKVGPSPKWMVKRLEALGSRSINNVVDATNLVMLECGHPMHAYDASKILGNRIEVRKAHAGEKLPLLDGSTITLEGFELVIADRERSVGLAGVMGGGNSEVQLETQNLFLECAEFDPVLVRRAASIHQKKTDAAHRFEKGIDPSGLRYAISRLADLIIQVAGGKMTGSVAAQLPSRQPEAPAFHREVSFELHYLNDFLGFERDQDPLTLNKTEAIFKGLECRVERKGDLWKVNPPSYRLDLNSREDFAEEIARSIGYDQIPATLPALTSIPISKVSAIPQITVMDRAKESLVRSGLLETVNFSFTSKAWLARFGMTSTVPVLNPLSEEYAVMTPSLIPGLIRNALDNWSHHFGSEPLPIRLFELRPVFSATGSVQADGEMKTGVQENLKLAFAVSGPRFAGGMRADLNEVDFYDFKSIIDNLLAMLGTKGARMIPFSASRTGGHPLFHPGQSAELLVGNSVAGHFGLLHPGKARDLKTRSPMWIAEFDWEILSKLSRKASEYPAFQSWSEFPPMERDFALIVKDEVTSEKLCQVALKAGKPLAKVAKVFDIYRGAQVAQGMTSVAVRVIFYHNERSLQESEVEQASARILENWKKELGAELRN